MKHSCPWCPPGLTPTVSFVFAVLEASDGVAKQKCYLMTSLLTAVLTALSASHQHLVLPRLAVWLITGLRAQLPLQTVFNKNAPWGSSSIAIGAAVQP